jgi:predicted Zn-dependent peptidase
VKHTVYEHKLAGGAKGLVIDVPGSAVVSLQVRFNSGFQFAPRATYEVPHVMEHLLVTVSKRHPKPNEFHIQATKNGAYVNAHTTSARNSYDYEFAAFELERILDLLEEQVTAPLIAEAPLATEISNVREELSRNTTQHGSVCGLQLGVAAFPELMLGYEERIEQLSNITVAQAQIHYERTHTAANARFVLAGNFADGGTQVVARLDRMFARLPAGERLAPIRKIGRGLAQPVVTERDIAQVYYHVQMYFGELDDVERRALWLLRVLEAGGFASRIFGAARRNGWAYHVAGLAQAEPGKSMFGVAGYVTPEHARPLFELVARELAAARAELVGEQELDAAKDLMVGTLQRSVQTSSDALGWYIDRFDEVGEVMDLDRTLELIRGVKAEEVQAVAGKASAAGRAGISFVGPVDQKLAGEYAETLAPIWEG